jgi:hypothetical protein
VPLHAHTPSHEKKEKSHGHTDGAPLPHPTPTPPPQTRQQDAQRTVTTPPSGKVVVHTPASLAMVAPTADSSFAAAGLHGTADATAASTATRTAPAGPDTSKRAACPRANARMYTHTTHGWAVWGKALHMLGAHTRGRHCWGLLGGEHRSRGAKASSHTQCHHGALATNGVGTGERCRGR